MSRSVATPVTYLFDPLCGWCYGAGPMLEALAADPRIALDLAPAGLFSGAGARPMDETFAAYAWDNDRRIARLTGQRFSEAYRREVLGDRRRRFDSGPATLALTAARTQDAAAELPALKAIQAARYVDGRDVTAVETLADILDRLGLAAAARRLLAPDAELLALDRGRTDAARAEMRRFGLTGVPVLLCGAGAARRSLETGALFGSAPALLGRLLAE